MALYEVTIARPDEAPDPAMTRFVEATCIDIDGHQDAALLGRLWLEQEGWGGQWDITTRRAFNRPNVPADTEGPADAAA